MSETDDTDDLLLIPPDFFVVDLVQESNAVVPYYRVFDSLISQVSDLENRITYIECSSADNSFDYSFSSENRPALMYENQDTRGNDSTRSTPQKPRTKFRLNSLPSSPNSERYSPRHTRTTLFAPKENVGRNLNEQYESRAPREERHHAIGEVDNFIASVNAIKKHRERNAERLNLEDVDKMLHELEVEESRNKNVEDVVKKQNLWNCGDNIDSVPDLGVGVRSLLYDHVEKPIVKENVTKVNVKPLDISGQGPDSFRTEERSPTVSSSDSTQETAFYRHKAGSSNLETIYSNPINTHKSSLQRGINTSSPKKTKNKYSLSESSKSDDKNDSGRNLRLLSLHDLWNQRSSNTDLRNIDRSLFFQKLEEERLRRQHCEQLIQELQTKMLELQERLAVAVEVDQAKDKAILKFHNAWEGVAERLQNLSKEKSRLEQDIERVRRKNDEDLEEAAQKMMHYEREASKALNLAHGNQEKLQFLERQCNDFKGVAHTLENKLHAVETSHSEEVEKNKKLMELIKQKENEIVQNKILIADARKEVAESKKAVDMYQNEFTAMKTECTQLRLQLNEERQKNLNADDHKKKLLNELELRKSNERSMKDEMEKQKTDLRNFYQNQVEVVVQDKLKEFQGQLEKAESALREELRSREFSIARTAAVHIQQISEKHALEVSLLEEKHREEVRLYQLQLSQNEQQTQNLQNKYFKLQQRWNTIAQKMESQLLETVKIFSSSRTPTSPHPNDFSTIDQINSLKSKSVSHLKELLSFRNDMPDMEVRPSKQEVPNKQYEETDGASSMANIEQDTPISSKSQKPKRQVDQEIQKYIQMLLNKSPGEASAEEQKFQEDFKAWQATTQEDQKNSKGTSNKERRLGKPPWK